MEPESPKYRHARCSDTRNAGGGSAKHEVDTTDKQENDVGLANTMEPITRFPRYTVWLQLERRLMSEIVGVGFEIHITQYVLRLDMVGRLIERKLTLCSSKRATRVTCLMSVANVVD